MKRAWMAAAALGLASVLSAGAWADDGHGRHHRHARYHDRLVHRELDRQLLHLHAHQYPMNWYQHQLLHDHLDHDRYHDRLDHRRYHRHRSSDLYYNWRSVYGYTPGYVPPAAVYSGYGYRYATPAIGVSGRNFSFYIHP